jgi:hypothetical protein
MTSDGQVKRNLFSHGSAALLSSLRVFGSALVAIDARKNYQADNLLAGFENFVWCSKKYRALLQEVSQGRLQC